MGERKCGCVYADASNTAAVRAGYELGGYLKTPCAEHAVRRIDPPIVFSPPSPEILSELATITSEPYDGPRTISELSAAFEAATPETFWQPALDSHTRIDLDHAPGTPVMAIDVDPMTGKVLGEPRWTVTPYPRLTAAEVTEPGWYWWRAGGRKRWRVIEVWSDVPGVLDAYMPGEEHVYTIGDDLSGTFIGPLRAPEGV